MLDIFNSDAFGVVSMTTAINKIPYVPTRIGELGLFSGEGVTTTSIAIEEFAGTLSLIPNQSRTGTVAQNTNPRAKQRVFPATHLPLEDTILAEAIQNTRIFGGGMDQGAAVAQIIAQKLANIRAKHDATLEFHRLGAVKGIILDADGTTTIRNLFTEYGLTQTVVGFDLDNASIDVGDKVGLIVDAIEANIGGATYDHIHAFVGATFFSKLTKHASVKDAYKYQLALPLLNQDRRSGSTFTIGNITFEKFSRTVGGVTQVGTNDAHFFPVGVPDLFKTFWAPANMVGAANTIGLPFYAKQEMLRYDRGVGIYTESNPLNICTRPEVLIKGTVAA